MEKQSIITTLCSGNKYSAVLEHWIKRVKQKCPELQIIIFDSNSKVDLTNFNMNISGYIWLFRFKLNINLLSNKPIIMCDLDCIIEKNLQPLIEIDADLIISTEMKGKEAYPKKCSEILGFGVCCGFMILKPSCKDFLLKILNNMKQNKYNTYDDQVNIMNHIVRSNYKIRDSKIRLDNKDYINKIIYVDDIKICVLDFKIITRNPILNEGQFVNHINIDNVGGSDLFIQYFYHNLEMLPLTCRCGKEYLDNYEICKYKDIIRGRSRW